MKIIQLLLDKIVAPLVLMLLTPIIIGIASKINTGDWMKWFGFISGTVWIIFWISIFLWVIAIVIYKRYKQLQKLDPGPRASPIVVHGPEWIAECKEFYYEYAGVVWIIRVHAPYPSSIEVETPPRCPECKTELEESYSFWGGHIWRCVGCGFKKRNRDSYYREVDRVKKIVRRKLEKQKHENPSI